MSSDRSVSSILFAAFLQLLKKVNKSPLLSLLSVIFNGVRILPFIGVDIDADKPLRYGVVQSGPCSIEGTSSSSVRAVWSVSVSSRSLVVATKSVGLILLLSLKVG